MNNTYTKKYISATAAEGWLKSLKLIHISPKKTLIKFLMNLY